MLKEEYNEAANIAHTSAIEKLSLSHHDNSNNTTTTATNNSSSISMSSSTSTSNTAQAAETVFFAPTIAAAAVETIGTLSVSSVTHSGSSGSGLVADSEATGVYVLYATS